MTDSDVPIAQGLFRDSRPPVLIGARCGECQAVTFPNQQSCPRCSSTDVAAVDLPSRGTLWTWTTQTYEPKSPPYLGDSGEHFEPFAVGYVELEGDVLVESLLTVADPAKLRIGMPMALTIQPFGAAVGAGVRTYAFEPIEED